MDAVSGVFKTRVEAENAVQEIRNNGIHTDKVTLLSPGTEKQIEHEAKTVPVDETEQPGMGKAFGALLGGGVGLAGGSALVALVPGIGPVTALGLLGAGILGAAGAALGATAGGKVENSMTEGLPHDEIFVYEDALRQGKNVVIALAENEEAADSLRGILQTQGAESIDAAREQWWVGLRNAEASHYEAAGGNFRDDEKFYRMGFEAALHTKNRCIEYDQVLGQMTAALEEAQKQYPNANVEQAFTRGYQRGRDHYERLCAEQQKVA